MKQDKVQKAGAIMFFLWGLLHIFAGLLLVVPFISGGSEALWSFYGWHWHYFSTLDQPP